MVKEVSGKSTGKMSAMLARAAARSAAAEQDAIDKRVLEMKKEMLDGRVTFSIDLIAFAHYAEIALKKALARMTPEQQKEMGEIGGELVVIGAKLTNLASAITGDGILITSLSGGGGKDGKARIDFEVAAGRSPEAKSGVRRKAPLRAVKPAGDE